MKFPIVTTAEGIVVAYPGQTVNCTNPTSRMSVFRVPGSDRMLVECSCGRTLGEPPELAPSKASTVWPLDQNANLSGDLSGFRVSSPGLGTK